MMPAVTSLDGKEVVWSPLPKQRIFIECPIQECLFGGAAGPGKTDAIIVCVCAGGDHDELLDVPSASA